MSFVFVGLVNNMFDYNFCVNKLLSYYESGKILAIYTSKKNIIKYYSQSIILRCYLG